MAENSLDAMLLKKAKAYSNIKHYISIAETAFYITFFIIIQYGGISQRLSDFLSSLSLNFYIRLALYMAVIGIALEAITFPLNYYRSFIIEHRYGLSKQALMQWLKDYIKGVAISCPLYFVMAASLFFFLKVSPGLWWLYTAGLYLLFGLLIAKIFPILVIPLFYRMEKLPDSPLKKGLKALAERAGVKIMDIYKIALGEKTNKANAALCGWGSTRRVVISDTLINRYEADEVESTLAHELAHFKRHHFWKLSLASFAVTLAGFYTVSLIIGRLQAYGYVREISDITILPVLAVLFSVYGIATSPLTNLISRLYEFEADKDAIALTAKPGIFASLMSKLAQQNLSDPSPAPLIKYFFYDHPPADERIKAAQRWQEKYGKK